MESGHALDAIPVLSMQSNWRWGKSFFSTEATPGATSGERSRKASPLSSSVSSRWSSDVASPSSSHLEQKGDSNAETDEYSYSFSMEARPREKKDLHVADRMDEYIAWM